MTAMAVTVTVDDVAFEMRISGADRWLCLSPGFRLPVADLTGARQVSWDEVRAGLGWRTWGGYFPGLFATGWYAVKDRPGARQFLAVFRDRAGLVMIETNVPQPARVVVASADPGRLVARVEAQVRRRR